ncbi:MAG TPA: hypothetical protein VFY85_15320 [Gemmatimonadaceae bacterium]|nr:hypothetical protein [Gemmatimonadaceae bacterium]
MSPLALAWIHRVALFLHLAGVVVWMGAVAYYLFILQPALRMAGMERPVRYALLVAIKARLRRVVGTAVIVIIASGLVNAQLRGLLGGATPADDVTRRVFFWKMVVVGMLVLIFLFALPALKRVRRGSVRGRLFNLVHVVVLVLGALATAGGILLSR